MYCFERWVEVRTGERDHVLLGESLRREERREVGEPRRRRGDVVLGAVEARRGRVSPPHLHLPARATQLHVHNACQMSQ